MFAWLHAAVRDKKGNLLQPRAEGYKGSQPDPGPLGYLLEYLQEIGPATVNGNIPAPVSWQEIQAWQKLTGINLEAFEALIIRELSRTYAEQYVKSEKIECPPPWMNTAADKAAVSERVKRLFRS
jgi:hypothetical protein